MPSRFSMIVVRVHLPLHAALYLASASSWRVMFKSFGFRLGRFSFGSSCGAAHGFAASSMLSRFIFHSPIRQPKRRASGHQ